MKRNVNVLGKLSCGKRAYAVFVLCATTAMALPAQTFTTLFSFDGADGTSPNAGFVQASNGNFYGTTNYGGANRAGTVFKIAPGGPLTTLYSFCSQSACADGEDPNGLVQAANGDLYGTTFGNPYDGGGANGPFGTVFKITPNGILTTLYSFCSQANCTDGGSPTAGLVQATNGDLYGTTAGGGNLVGAGTVFRITPSGALTTLYTFCAQYRCPDGEGPAGALVQATNGDLYGTTFGGGANGVGTVFKITPSGTLTTLHNFAGYPMDGANPGAGLVQATNGDLYGTTYAGGANPGPYGLGGGTIFTITPSGALTTLYSFCAQSACTDGANPGAGLVQATDGDLYGTNAGGVYNAGTVFKITSSGTLTTLYSLCSQSACTDGSSPNVLVQATNGNLYGTTRGGGAHNAGSIFRLSVGLGPFVETQPSSGNVGAAVNILGTDLTGATSVSFDGIAAVFTVVGHSLITTTVPAGASSGEVQVVTPGGTLSSNVPFLVVP